MTDREYKERYLEDVKANRSGELITLEVLNNLDNGYVFEDVAEDDRYYCKGDILMKKEGKKTKKLDVKNSKQIARTGNFDVEAGGWSKVYNCPKRGWIDNNYDYVAVISQSECIIWILSMKRLKQVYNKVELTGGRKVTSDFWDNEKWNYLIPISKAIELDVVLAKIEYEFDDLWEEYMPTEYKSKNKLKAG